MSDSESEIRDRVIELAERMLEGEGNAVRAELEEILQQPEARRIYIEYVDMHSRLAARHSPELPRIVAERFVYERVEAWGANKPNVFRPLVEVVADRSKPWGQIGVLLLFIVFVAAVSAWIVLDRKPAPSPEVGTLTRGIAFSENSHRRLHPGRPIHNGTSLRFEEDAVVEIRSGYTLHITARSRIAFLSQSEWDLEEGRIRVAANGEQKQSARLRISSAELRAVQGRWIAEAKSNGPSRLFVESGEVEVRSVRQRPRHYWPFDAANAGRTKDEAGGAEGVVGDGAKSIQGLVGAGALDFNNSRDAIVAFGGGGGQALGTGSFAMDQAVSIETLFVSRWSGRGAPKSDNMNSDAEVLFRKQDPGNLILLLQFKNYHSFRDADPKIDYSGPALAFGLYLVGSGYKELTVPLDGVNGRPDFATIVDGKPHHIVATYDCRTGAKRLYLDGRVVAEHAYTPGTRILSGGPGKAAAGNHPTQFDEPFTGILDEMAVYDIPLSPFVVGEHWKRAKAGRAYFGAREGDVHGGDPEGWTITAPADISIDRDFGFPIQE